MNEKQKPVLIKDWIELSKVEDSETHMLKIDFKNGFGWVKSKTDETDYHYL